MLRLYFTTRTYYKLLNVSLYANDIVIFSSTASGLQERHVQHVNYCSDWRLKANVVKIKVIVTTQYY